MATLTEKSRPGEALLSQADGALSIEQVIVLSGRNLEANTVAGKVANGAGSYAAVAGNTGNGTIGTITVGAGAKAGVHKLVCVEPIVNAGRFTLEDPDGITIGAPTVAVAFSGGGLTFTIADGAVDFLSGDAFNVTVAAGSGKFVAYDPTGTDGREKAVGVMLHSADATDSDVISTAIVRLAELNSDKLVWGAGVTTQGHKDAAIAALAVNYVIAR